jgi:gluconolactonase
LTGKSGDETVRSVATMRDVRVLATGLDHPEGVTLGPDGMLYAGGEAGQVYRVDPGSGALEDIALVQGGYMLGLCCDAAGRVYVCDAANAVVWRVGTDGSVERWCDAAEGATLTCPNWPAFAADGTLYVSDSGPEDSEEVGGRVLRVPPSGGDAEVLEVRPLHFANGLALLEDGDLVVHESFSHRMVAIRASGVEEVAHFGTAIPDGVAITADGGFVVGMYYPYELHRVSPDGASEILLHDMFGTVFPMPTNVCFFGEGLTTLAVASLGGHALAAVEVDFQGTALHYPTL